MVARPCSHPFSFQALFSLFKGCYNQEQKRGARLELARGWESKAVEDQINEADERARREESAQDDLSPAERARRQRLESLKLSRARTLDQLERATNRAYREMLQRTLRALESEIDTLG
jgi:biopolymer transport protein ExbB/TolQ